MSTRHDVIIRRDGSHVVVQIPTPIENPHDGLKTAVFTFTWETASVWSAALLTGYLDERHKECIRAIRQAEYNAGWRDARSHHTRKSTHFSGAMDQVAANY